MQCTNQTITIHTDGSCFGPHGPGGWSAIVESPGSDTVTLTGGEPATTCNRMELTAAIEALRFLKAPSKVILVTDSQYLSRGISSWIKNWKRRNWMIGKRPVKNQDLWRQLDNLNSIHNVRWQWVRGHNGNEKNNRADRLANEAAFEQKCAVNKNIP